jgi:acyl-coenzyme A synthetase/AMP-(fatty) acid ligase/acyl carrier protein
LFNSVTDEDPEVLTTVRQLITGGEALSVPHVRRALKLLPDTELINGYGPTESTTFACAYRIPKKIDDHAPSIPIGRPIGNTRVYILDRHLQPVPIGVAGELYIGGDGLARGYLNQVELTRAKFIPDPFSQRPGARLYRSGDRVRYRSDGNIEFLGRIDDQVKIRGFRVEPGEVEASLRENREISNAAVVVGKTTNREKCLVAYVVGRNGAILRPEELRAFLQQKLPEYMVPSRWIFLEKFPLTAGGKIDKRAVVLLQETYKPERVVVAPRNTLERRLLAIWENVLGVRPIGVTEDFFDLGGHSILAVRLFAEIEKAFGKKLRIGILLSAPTIEQLAGYLERATQYNSSSLVAIQPNGSNPPLF